jgi:hypothetical protein
MHFQQFYYCHNFSDWQNEVAINIIHIWKAVIMNNTHGSGDLSHVCITGAQKNRKWRHSVGIMADRGGLKWRHFLEIMVNGRCLITTSTSISSMISFPDHKCDEKRNVASCCRRSLFWKKRSWVKNKRINTILDKQSLTL